MTLSQAEDLFLLLTGLTDIVVEVAVQTQSEPGAEHE